MKKMRICKDPLGIPGDPCPCYHPEYYSDCQCDCDPQTQYECGGLTSAEEGEEESAGKKIGINLGGC